MEQNISLQQAMQALHKQYGESIQAGQEEGREMMATTLQQELNVSQELAQAIVRDLEAAQSIRWTEPSVEQGAQDPGPAVIAPGSFDPDTARIVASIPAQGYWQL